MLTELTHALQLPPATVAAFKQLRNGVDYTQNPIAHGGFHDGSIPIEAWTAARNAAQAFEALQRALDALNAEVIPF